MKVKICGIMRAEDAQLAALLGAWAVGFIFWPKSPRFVDAAGARSIADALPARVERVGVFVDEAPDRVREIVAAAGLTIVQLHGHESRKDWDLTTPVMKAVGLANGDQASVLDDWRDVRALLDAHDPARRGGTGRTIDWNAAAAVARSRDIVLAGGLRPENVADAVARVRPWGIDVSSGVEDAPGLKNHERMRALFAAVNQIANEMDASSGRAEARPLRT
jgi:phosphoribosylanthranilate isomerase